MNRVKGRDWYDLNGMYVIMFRWILLIWQNDASSSTMRIFDGSLVKAYRVTHG